MSSSDNSSDNYDFSTIPKAARSYIKLGYNILPILPKGTKYPRRRGNATIVIADGKSAEGLGQWRHWIEEKQDPDFIETFESATQKANSNLSEYLTKDEMVIDEVKNLNVGLIHGNASRLDIDDDSSSRNKFIKTGSGVFECDGIGADLFWEVVLSSGDLRHKLMRTPRIRSPSGGLHWYFRYVIPHDRLTGEEIKLPSQDLYQGKGHNEIKLLGHGKYTITPPSEGYSFELHDFNNIAILSFSEISRLANLIKRVDKRETSGPLWTDSEKYQDISNNRDAKYSLLSIAKIIYEAATKQNRRHDTALAFSGILKKYVKLNKEDTHSIIDGIDPKDSKNYAGVEDTYRKKDNEITSMNSFRKLIMELLGEEQAGELIDELLSLTVPERTYYSEKPDGKLLGLAIDNVEECVFDQNHISYAIIHDKKNNSYQITKLKSEQFKLNLSKWFVENNNGYELARNEHKIQTIDTLMSLITKKPFTLYDRSVWIREQNMVYYNLNDESSQIVKIIPDIEGKFEIVKQSPEFLLFRKLQDKCKQVSPSALSELEPGHDYLEPLTMGLKSESQKLIFKCWLISLYFNSVSYPIIYATGPERNENNHVEENKIIVRSN